MYEEEGMRESGLKAEEDGKPEGDAQEEDVEEEEEEGGADEEEEEEDGGVCVAAGCGNGGQEVGGKGERYGKGGTEAEEEEQKEEGEGEGGQA
jgi:hypothetical protein